MPASPSPTTAVDAVASEPVVVLVSLGLLTAVLIGLVVVLANNFLAPRALLKRLSDPNSPLARRLSAEDLKTLLSRSSRVVDNVTRTALAVTGFSIIGVISILAFATSGDGLKDVRSTLVGALTSLVATISGFSFATRALQPGRATGSEVPPTGGGGSGHDDPPSTAREADPREPADGAGRPAGTRLPLLKGRFAASSMHVTAPWNGCRKRRRDRGGR